MAKEKIAKRDSLESKTKQNKKDASQLNREVFKIIAAMVGLFVIFLIFNFIFSHAGKFDYQGLPFTIEKYGNLPIYHYYYYFKSGPSIYKYNLYLRNDPRTLTNIPVNDTLGFTTTRPVYITINARNLIHCNQSNIAIAGLSAFFTNNLMKVYGATTNPIEAQVSNLTYATCNTVLDGDVITVTDGNETRIDKTYDQNDKKCYTIEIANCQVLQATERFIVQTIVDTLKNKGTI